MSISVCLFIFAFLALAFAFGAFRAFRTFGLVVGVAAPSSVFFGHVGEMGDTICIHRMRDCGS
jgi:hypothetical protein